MSLVCTRLRRGTNPQRVHGDTMVGMEANLGWSGIARRIVHRAPGSWMRFSICSRVKCQFHSFLYSEFGRGECVFMSRYGSRFVAEGHLGRV